LSDNSLRNQNQQFTNNKDKKEFMKKTFPVF
jgi:hypothetical protein